MRTPDCHSVRIKPMQLSRRSIFISAVLFGAAPALLAPLNAQAENSRFYLGARYASYSFDPDNAVSADDSTGYGVTGGMLMSQQVSMEFEYGNSGKADFTGSNGTIDSGKLQAQNLAVFGAYRTPGTIYLKLKAGISIHWLDAIDIQCSGRFCVNTLSEESGGLAYGLGLGALLGNRFRTELEYSAIDEDINLISLGILINL
ncbi:MAG: hypothetical protein CSH49_14460 [Alcanivorax sp.]|nr:MAG: hypothetical protein CSH49_14460 [Alcanivorax sp.]